MTSGQELSLRGVPEDFAHSSDISSRRIFNHISHEREDARRADGLGPECVLTDEAASSLGTEDRRAVFNLAPLLSSRDKEACPSIFNDPALRAQRWKEQRSV